MQWLLTRKVWLLNTRKVHLAHFLKKVDIVRFNSKPLIYNEENEVISDEKISDAIYNFGVRYINNMKITLQMNGIQKQKSTIARITT